MKGTENFCTVCSVWNVSSSHVTPAVPFHRLEVGQTRVPPTRRARNAPTRQLTENWATSHLNGGSSRGIVPGIESNMRSWVLASFVPSRDNRRSPAASSGFSYFKMSPSSSVNSGCGPFPTRKTQQPAVATSLDSQGRIASGLTSSHLVNYITRLAGYAKRIIGVQRGVKEEN